MLKINSNLHTTGTLWVYLKVHAVFIMDAWNKLDYDGWKYWTD